MSDKALRNTIIVIAAVVVAALVMLREFRDTIFSPGQEAAESAQSAVDTAQKILDTKPEDVVKTTSSLFNQFAQVAEVAANEVLGLSLEEEQAIGRQFHEEIISTQEVNTSPKIKHQVEVLTYPFLQARHRIDLDITFTVLESPEVNAFSHIGGYIYITTGIIEFVENDADAIQFIVGHELGHIDLGQCTRHVMPAVRAGQFAGKVGADLVSTFYGILSSGYSQDEEYACDKYSYLQMRKLDGMTQDRALSGVRYLVKLDEEYDDGAPSSVHPQQSELAKTVVDIMDQYMRSHPRGADRLERLKGLQ